jgi:hypothetical protein
MKIDSDNGLFRACVDVADDGLVEVTYWHRGLGEVGWKPLYADQLDCPFHVALDAVHDVVQQLTPEVKAWPTRLHVVTVDGRHINHNPA